MANVKKMKKYQGGGTMDPRVAEFLNKRRAADTTKMYDRGEAIETINKITRGEIKPRVDKPVMSGTGKGTTKYGVVSGKDTTYMSKADFEKKYGKGKNGSKLKKAKSGGSFPDLNKDGKITKADILKGRGVIAKKGAAIKKKAQEGTSIAYKLAEKTKERNTPGTLLRQGQRDRLTRISEKNPERAMKVASRMVTRAKSKMKNGGSVSMQLGSYKNVIGKNTKGKATKAVGLTKAKYGKSMGKCKNGC